MKTHRTLHALDFRTRDLAWRTDAHGPRRRPRPIPMDSAPRTRDAARCLGRCRRRGFGGLAPGTGAVTLSLPRQAWIEPIAAAAQKAGLDLPLADHLHRLLLLRRGAPTEAVWRLEARKVLVSC